MSVVTAVSKYSNAIYLDLLNTLENLIKRDYVILLKYE